MNAAGRSALWARLRDAGIVAGDVPPAGEDAAPWYVRAMIGIAAWIAAVFLIAAVLAAVSSLFRSGGAMALVGLVLCAIGLALLRAGGRNIFVEQFGFAISLAGQGLVAGGVLSGGLTGGGPGPKFEATQFLIVALFEAGLVAAVPARVHRTLCTLAGAVAVGGALIAWQAAPLYAPVVALLFALAALAGVRDGARLALWQPVAVGLALGLVASIVLLIVEPNFAAFNRKGRGPGLPPEVGAAGTTIVFAVVVAQLLRTAGVASASRAGIALWALACALAAAAWFVSGLLAAGILVLVAFAIGHEVLLGLGVIALLATLSRHYYGLEATLLVKSAALLATGVVLLAAWCGLRFFPPVNRGDDRA